MLLDALEARRLPPLVRARRALPDAAAAGPPAARPARVRRAALAARCASTTRAGTIARPPGLRLDLGGSGKGLVADSRRRAARGAGALVVDAGGDVRVRGAREVLVAHPLAAGAGGARSRCGRRGRDVGRRAPRVAPPGGGRAHHLLDPATGEPAWTGVLAATALAPTALEAETLAKTALLAGPARARRRARRARRRARPRRRAVEPSAR